MRISFQNVTPLKHSKHKLYSETASFYFTTENIISKNPQKHLWQDRFHHILSGHKKIQPNIRTFKSSTFLK